MLAISVRVRPCSERLRRSSSGRWTAIAPSSSRWTTRGSATLWVRVPLGPLTITSRPSMVTSTPAGTGTGSRPMRDMGSPPSPDVGEDFPTHALLCRLPIGEQAGCRGQDGDAEATENPGQVRGLGVDAQAGLRHPPDAGDRALTGRAVLQLDHELLAHLGVLDGPGRDVALGLEDLGDVRLQLAERHAHAVVVRRVGVAQTREHVRDGVGHGHRALLPFLTVVSDGPDGP